MICYSLFLTESCFSQRVILNPLLEAIYSISPNRYVATLEKRLEAVQQLLQKVCRTLCILLFN